MRFTEKSLTLGVDSLSLFEYLGHFKWTTKAMVDVAAQASVSQDIRVALGLVENLFVAKFFSYDPKDDYEREVTKGNSATFERPLYLTRSCYEFLANPYLKAQSENLSGPERAIDGELADRSLPVFEQIVIDQPFNLSNARWLQGTIQTNAHLKGRLAPGLIQPAEVMDSDEDGEYDDDPHYRFLALHRIKVVVNDEGLVRNVAADKDDAPRDAERGASRYDGVNLFAISYQSRSYDHDCLIEVSRSFESDGSLWRLSVEVKCDADIREFRPSECTLLQSTLTTVIGADLIRLAYLAVELENPPSIECSIRFTSGSLGGLRESMDRLSKSDGFWKPIPEEQRNLFHIAVT
ncbi:hypothetical protein QO002_005393 [Pararhizobium capsulatum DSM 1112]|uniref:Uncharacterized protein n=1 Tax=Pararhizobium capsulatum DSM 1112 TaxID=1121113 RepID=A0ABU0BY50_9HYPH|nr:hypothetical protein [Pararhizobium capsulatum]MDQ0323187.1 hypothetical protein [Pararhizobium capsulatum DSM 1112]